MDVECPQGRLTEYNVMDDCGAVLHNIETKWLYDFLTLEKMSQFFPGGSQSQRLATGIQPPHPCTGTGDWR